VRIIYIHVPSAWLGMAGWSGIAGASFMQLVWRHPLSERRRARAGGAGRGLCRDLPADRIDLGPADLGHVVAVGRAADLDARPVLPLSRLYRARERCGPRGRSGQRITAIFGMVGAVNLPIIHYSVLWWKTLHQGQSIGLSGSSIDSSLLWPLPLSALGFTLIFASVVLMRMRAMLAEAKVEARLKRLATA
jgi:heme exporter protein C